jgi:hypothetical protein
MDGNAPATIDRLQAAVDGVKPSLHGIDAAPQSTGVWASLSLSPTIA